MSAKPRRHRGPIPDWNPRESTLSLIADVVAVLNEARASGVVPLSVRSIYYRLLGTGKYTKGKGLASRVSEHVGNARRANVIDWDDVYDSGETWLMPFTFDDFDDWRDATVRAAETFRLDFQKYQERNLLVWSEAAGLVPLLALAADPFGVPVLSTSGFDSTTIRHHVGATAHRPLTVLHVGDLDPAGESIFRAAAEDVTAWADYHGNSVEFVRLAVTPEQVVAFGLPDDPDKPGNVQAEAVPPTVMRGLVRDAIEARTDETARAMAQADQVEAHLAAVAMLAESA